MKGYNFGIYFSIRPILSSEALCRLPQLCLKRLSLAENREIMIQRIQSVYLLVTLIILTVFSCGIPVFSYHASAFHYRLNAFGITKFDEAGVKVVETPIPFYVGGIVLIMLCLFSLMLFKNLKRQLALARFTAFLYFVAMVFLVFAAFLGTYFTQETEKVSVSLELGFYMLIVGLPLLLLAVRGINKDKQLIDSVNRLR